MKRSPIRRRTPLERYTPLQGGAPLARKTPLRAQSAKRRRENRERAAMVRTLWPDMTPPCVVNGCTRLADDVHEPLSRARGGSITDPANAVPICRPHHDELTFGEPEWAYEQGTRVWRKTRREALKGAEKGRRSTHRVETQEPVRGSSWRRRHPGEMPPWLRRRLGES